MKYSKHVSYYFLFIQFTTQKCADVFNHQQDNPDTGKNNFFCTDKK